MRKRQRALWVFIALYEHRTGFRWDSIEAFRSIGEARRAAIAVKRDREKRRGMFRQGYRIVKLTVEKYVTIA